MIKIRVMNIKDYEGIYDLWINIPGMGLNTTDDSREGIDKYLRRNPTSNFVAEDDGKIIGVIMSGHDGRRGYIYHTAVLPNYRNQGIAKKLVDNAMNALDKEGINKVGLVAFERNESGNGFWKNIGFVVRDDLVYRNKNIHELKRISYSFSATSYPDGIALVHLPKEEVPLERLLRMALSIISPLLVAWTLQCSPLPGYSRRMVFPFLLTYRSLFFFKSEAL